VANVPSHHIKITLLHYVIHVSSCFCFFPDINISNSSAAICLRWTFYHNFAKTFTAKSVSERILKIGQYLTKSETNI